VSESLHIYAYGDTGITEINSATGSIYLGDTWVDRHHCIIGNTHSIFPSSWSHALWPRVHTSTQFVLFILAGYPFISSHPLSTLLEPEPLYLKHSLWMPCEVWRSVDDGCVPSSSTGSPHSDRVNVDMHFMAVIKWVWRCTWRQSWSEIEDMHLEAMITWTWRSWSSEFGDALVGCDRGTLEAVIERVWRCTWRPWSCKPGGCNQRSLEISLEAVIDKVWRCTWMPWSSAIGAECGGGQSRGGSSGRRCEVSWDCIRSLTRNCGNVENWVLDGLPRDERLGGSGRELIVGWFSTQCMQYSVYAILGVCCTWCMLYLVYAVLSVNSWSWYGEIERDDLTLCS